MTIAVRIARVARKNKMSLSCYFAFVARNYRFLSIGDAFISTVEYAFVAMLRNCGRSDDFNRNKLRKIILRTMLVDGAFYDEKLIREIYHELTKYDISTREMLNFQSAFDARRTKNHSFDAYYEKQMNRAEKARAKIKNNEYVSDDEREHARGVIIIPATVDVDFDRGQAIRIAVLFKTIGRYFGHLWRGVGAGGLIFSLSNLWPGLTAVVFATVCAIKRIALPLPIVGCIAAAIFFGTLTVKKSKQEKLYKNLSATFLVVTVILMVIGIFGPTEDSQAQQEAQVTITSTTRSKPTPRITPTPTVEPTPYIASGTILFNGEIKARSGKNKNYAVYTGPSESYYRVGNSNVYFGTDIGCAGVEDGWYLIWYDYVGKNRKIRKIGWTEAYTSDVENIPVPTLEFSRTDTWVTENCQMTDGKDYYGNLKKGQGVIYLCVIKSAEIVKGTEKMAYIEAEIDGVKRRGLIPYDCLPWKEE